MRAAVAVRCYEGMSVGAGPQVRPGAGGEGDPVAILVQGDVAHYAGLPACGSVWACPVCAAKILDTRAAEIASAAAGWDQAGNSV